MFFSNMIKIIILLLNYFYLIQSQCDIDSIRNECFAEATEIWPLTNASHQTPHRICCWHWDVFDCVEMAACNSCTQDQEILIEKEYNDEKSKLKNGTCVDYPYGSVKCHIPIWFYALVFNISCLTIASLYLIITYCRRIKMISKRN